MYMEINRYMYNQRKNLYMNHKKYIKSGRKERLKRSINNHNNINLTLQKINDIKRKKRDSKKNQTNFHK